MAFANTAGGILLLGVDDRSRHVRGVREPLDLKERLANLISDLIVPAPVCMLTRRDLESLRLVTSHQSRQVPTVGGMLLFGRDRERYVPDSWIQAGRFAGISLTPRATRTRPARLVGRGLVPEVGTGPLDPKRRYFRAG